MKDSVTGMVAAILGMIPEGLYLLASVAMVVSVMRLGKQKVLIHDMKCIETLARVNVLCVDKTGTITVPEMEVAQFILAKDQNLAAKEQEADQQSEDKNKIAKLLSDCVRALPCDNATMEALQQYFTEPMENSAEKIVRFRLPQNTAEWFWQEKLMWSAHRNLCCGRIMRLFREQSKYFWKRDIVCLYLQSMRESGWKRTDRKCNSHCIYPAQQCNS